MCQAGVEEVENGLETFLAVVGLLNISYLSLLREVDFPSVAPMERGKFLYYRFL